MRVQGNSVSQRHQVSQRESDDENYTGSSGSYTEFSGSPPRLQQQQLSSAVAGAQRTPRMEQGSLTSGLQPSPSSVNRGAAQGHQHEEGGETAQEKSGAARGRQKVLTRVNAALEAPAARMRAVTNAVVGKDSQRVTIYVFFCVAWAHLLFVILFSALSQIDMTGGGCYTFWGFKKNCDTVSYTRRTSLIKNCRGLRSSLKTGAAFSILAILASTVTLITSWLLCIRLREAHRYPGDQSRYMDVDVTELGAEAATLNNSNENRKQGNEALFNAGTLKKVMMIVIAFDLAFQLICWSITASIYTHQYCDNIYHWSTSASYGVGFGIGLTAWLMELIAFIPFIMLV
ncbi:hypothetical protein LSCM4_03890 [Leishmania orientalis]|uniref:Amastin-like protein n=1 Tax=Leishmania orientalis TaxID=2249476 RepID=A0A836HD73_9TRYP|nr:hypothetical protein LSCM4_03890 [Leishmania orientalis]